MKCMGAMKSSGAECQRPLEPRKTRKSRTGLAANSDIRREREGAKHAKTERNVWVLKIGVHPCLSVVQNVLFAAWRLMPS